MSRATFLQLVIPLMQVQLLMFVLSIVGVRQAGNTNTHYPRSYEVTEWKSGYLVDDEIWLLGSELIDPSCKFWMCLYPAGTISMCDGFRSFTGDVSFMWQDAKVQAIEYQTQLGIIRKRAKYLSDPIIQDIIK